MSGHGEKQSRQKEAAIIALLACPTIAAADRLPQHALAVAHAGISWPAGAAGIGPRMWRTFTVRWM